MKVLDASEHKSLGGGPSFSLRNRIFRAIWIVTWSLLAAWTPPPCFAWRRLLLKLFGAQVGANARVYGSTRVWLPSNLTLGDNVLIGPRVTLYNQGAITIGSDAVISQGSHICASSHDISDRHFQLILRPIKIGAGAWIAADAFVGPGVTIGEGAVLGARGAIFRDMEPWGVYGGNPAMLIKHRKLS